MDQGIKAEIGAYLAQFEHRDCLAVTLTLKKNFSGQWIDKASASRNFMHFKNRLNKRLFGNAASRFNRSINVIPVLEFGWVEERPHYHAIFQKPTDRTFETLAESIKKCWLSTRFGYRQIDIQHQYDSGWTSYISKFKHHEDALDWENFHWT